MRSVTRSLAIALSLLSLTACSIQEEYVAADRATFEAIGPEYRAYVESDTKLEADAKARRLRTLETWKIRLEGVGTP